MFKTITAALLIAPMALAVAGLTGLAMGEKAHAQYCSGGICSSVHQGQRYVWVK
jgi:hypothetical protein